MSKNAAAVVVGIGASAGGLEAFTQLLENLPADTGMAFVLVQHLDPKHDSALVDILSRTTTMPVREAASGMRVEPDCVYVIPPNAEISLSGGALKLRRREEAAARRSIDAFFESLAADEGERAIGVVLSGTASDGTMGLEAIKAEGGLTFAQDESAKYDGMPRSAVIAGCVDYVLPPKAIAKELARVARHPRAELGGAAGGDARGDANFRKIVALLRTHADVDFSLYKPATLKRRVQRRMIMLKIASPEAYVRRLREDVGERDALYHDVLIGVTSFFRDPDAFAALSKKVLPRLFKGRTSDDPVRIWVPGCSTGQEAYSLAMVLLEFMGDDPRIPLQIYATDLNEASLEKARAGLYVKSQLQEVSPERLRRFFVEEQGAYRVAKDVREMCVFAKHDLLSDPPFSRMDLISCRNLLIYVDLEVQKKVPPSFHYALKPGGALFLGASESVGAFTDLFLPADKHHRLYFKLPGPARPAGLAFPAFRARPAKTFAGRPVNPESGKLDLQREADRVALSKYAPPAVLVNESLEIIQFRGETSPFLHPPQGKPTFQLLKMAREELLLPLRSAVMKARKAGRRIRREDVRFTVNGRARRVSLDVIPLRNLKERCLLVSFETRDRFSAPPSSAAERGAPPERAPSPAQEVRESARLREELSETRDYLQSLQSQYEAANEELQASGEEIQSSNEELQSINEELETSKEELESTNEELTTVNEEMASRNAALTRVTGDLNNLHASVDIAILLLSRDLRIKRFTPRAEKLFNLMAGDVDRPLSAVKSTLDFPEMESVVSEVISTVSLRGREVRDREGRWYSFRARPYVTLDNKIDGAVVTVVDITDLKRASQKAEAIAETVPPLLILDDQLRVQKANRTFQEMFRVTAAETEGRLVYELGGGRWNLPRLRTLLQEVLPRDKSFADFEVEQEFPDLGPRTLMLNGRELEWGEGGRLILLSILDITDRKTALRKIERYSAELERSVRHRTAELTASNEELEAFCYSVAHDLRTPLRGIAGFSSVLTKEFSADLDERGKDCCARIRTGAARMSILIDSLLDLARLTRAELRREEVDLSATAQSIAEEFKSKEPKRAAAFVIAPGITASGDERLLRIALTSLLENAWKFTSHRPRARIEFGTHEEGGERIFFVRDNGAGFDMAYSGKLFQAFQRLHSEEEFPGTGIGLTIAQRIVRRHGGRIWADGSPDKGATFSFTLPLPDNDAPRGRA